ncbi:uncharacterized protein LOC129412172 [Boleophthalmus pectinirostris]|uniref:uncharacterized protein LOC129412172 n=1 Tax=Boleophthalmus pectinirostris TaxID=150288 RepID=UPI002430AAA3|nr:uncharacterized protein LOC129412172 [Boleophthalmus pectinirostris]
MLEGDEVTAAEDGDQANTDEDYVPFSKVLSRHEKRTLRMIQTVITASRKEEQLQEARENSIVIRRLTESIANTSDARAKEDTVIVNSLAKNLLGLKDVHVVTLTSITHPVHFTAVSLRICATTSTLSRRYFGFSTSVSCCNTSHCNVPDLGLQCLTCTDSSCSSQRSVTCSKLAPFCYTDAYAGSYDYGSYNYSYSGIRKGCASSSVCTAAGSEFISYDYGSRSYLKNKTCCDTDDCNAPNPTSPPVGSLQCYSCDPDSYECTANVSCNTQEVCGQAVVDQYNPSRPFYGCVSENLCNNTNLSRQYFGFSTSVSCCNTSHCNVPDLGLQCSTCTDSSCSSQRSVTCSKLAPFCYTDAYAGSYNYGSSSYITIRKGCASSSVCTAAGSQVYSYDYGYSSYIRNKTCCDTDDCNAPNPTFHRLQCMSGSGSSQRLVNCSYQTTACYSRSYTGSYDYGDNSYTYNYTYKGCASASDCTAAGSEFVSYNYGPNTYAVNTTCCDTDNCNENHSIVAPPVGSLQCYSCDPYSYECTANVTCNTQEVCGQAVVDQYNPSRPFYGCVSENLCNNITLSQRYFGFSTSVSCCNTSHCNVPDLGLQCLSCTDSSCSSQRSVTCSKLAPFCYTDAYAGSYSYGNYNYSGIRKGCASSSVCTAAGSEFVSYDYGSSSYLKNKTCCDTDDCNAPNPTSPPVGSLQCYGCDPYSYECTANVSCNTQEVCGQAVDDRYNPSRPFYGCVSENLCNNITLSQRYFGFSTSVSCCNTSHCNVPDLGIQCLTCTDSSCSSQRSVTCSKLAPAPFCYTDAYAASYDYGSYNYSYSQIRKGCASSSVCTAAGSEFVSYDTGSRSYLRNYTCCDTDDCNAPNPTSPPAGSLQCYGCDPNTNECKATVTCSVLETCSNTSVGSYSVYGCVSENLCNNLTFSQRYLYTNNQPLSCCNTSYCNAPWTTTEAPPTTTYTTPTTTEAPPTTTYTTPTTTEAPPTTKRGANPNKGRGLNHTHNENPNKGRGLNHTHNENPNKGRGLDHTHDENPNKGRGLDHTHDENPNKGLVHDQTQRQPQQRPRP